MFAAILGSLVMGTLASKVGENIVGKRLGMSEKDRKLLGTVFGMAGGAYGGYAGSAGFGSSGIGATGASGSAGGMGGQSPKVGGDYATSMSLYNQPQPQTFTGFNQPMSSAYSSPQTFTGVDAPFSSMASGNGYAGTPYQPIDTYSSQIGSADMPPVYEYNQMAGMPAETYGMDMYANNSYGNSNEMYSIGRPDNTWANPNAPTVKPDNWFDMIEVPQPRYQGPSSGNVSAETFAIESPSRTIDLAPSGTPLEVVDVGAYQAPTEPLYGVDPTSPTNNYLSQPYQTGTQSGSNLSMESAFQTGGDEIRLIQANGDGTFTDLSTPDLSTSQGVEEFINMDQIRIDEMNGGPLDPFGQGQNITAANSSVSGPPQSVGSYIEDGVIIDNSLNPDPRNTYATKIKSAMLEPPKDSIGRPILSDGIKAQAAYDAEVPLLDPQGTTAGLKAEAEAKIFADKYGPTPEQIQATAQEKVDNARKKLAEGGKKGDARAIEREKQNIASTIDEVRANMQKQMTEDPSKLEEFLKKIPDGVKQWAAETGISLLDMWIQQELFGQDYDDQIAEGGGGGGRTLSGTSPMVSPYSGGGGGGSGGKGLLFSMGGGGQQGKGTHIMALQ